jgi:hypothetical protein
MATSKKSTKKTQIVGPLHKFNHTLQRIREGMGPLAVATASGRKVRFILVARDKRSTFWGILRGQKLVGTFLLKNSGGADVTLEDGRNRMRTLKSLDQALIFVQKSF